MVTMSYSISKSIYNKEVILKVSYLFQEDVKMHIEEDDNNYLLIVDNPKDSEFDWNKFNQILQEQQLREYLNNQFGTLRQAIYLKAFENFQDR